jgi:hypothetical protein
MAGLGLVQPPAAFVLEPVVMSTGVAPVAVGGGSTMAIVAGVVLSAVRAGARHPIMMQDRSRISR